MDDSAAELLEEGGEEQLAESSVIGSSQEEVRIKQLENEVRSKHDTPEELENQRRKLTQYKGVREPASVAFLATSAFSMVSLALPDYLTAATFSLNAIPAYAGWQIKKANDWQEEIDKELENWWLFGNDYDLSDVLEGSDTLDDSELTMGFDSPDEMLESHEGVRNCLEGLQSELEQSVSTDIAHEDFLEDKVFSLQALRIEEDDFGSYKFQLNVYLGETQIVVYHGITDDEEVVQDVKEEGLNARGNRDVIGSYFDLVTPYGHKLRKPEKL